MLRPARRTPRAPGTARRGRSAATPGPVRPTYAPAADGDPDPGEVVWAWVPYEDDPARGKDRPVLVLAREGRTLVALMLSSQDHDRDAADEARHGRVWTDVGTGGWDARRRPSEVRLDRVLRLPAHAVRREGAALDRSVFERVARAAARLHGW
ncbi:type II toxin-antitoxin system PemK/MazF family toxin [Cellulomonas sp. JZ18]|nr:type II toxin-antitoxin system PemK/MazF family toxin [Cellulomonas sp. JZ18]